jgi:hypothetical protein
MTVTATPIFAQSVKHTTAQITATGNTNVDGTTGTYTTIYTAGANGSKIERIRINSVGTTVADKVRLFIGGKLYQEILFAAFTPSNTVTNNFVDIDCSQAGNALYMTGAEVMIANVNTGTASLFNVHVFSAEY